MSRRNKKLRWIDLSEAEKIRVLQALGIYRKGPNASESDKLEKGISKKMAAEEQWRIEGFEFE